MLFTFLDFTMSFVVSPYEVFISDQIRREYYVEEDYVHLYCDFNGGPDNVYQWLINDRPLNSSIELYCQIVRADEDGGIYTCNVSNPAGSNSSSIVINTVPVIEVAPMDTNTSVGENITFSCRARGYPIPTYQWNSTSGSLPDNSEVLSDENGTSILRIFSVTLEDEGEYFCTVIGITTHHVSAALTIGMIQWCIFCIIVISQLVFNNIYYLLIVSIDNDVVVSLDQELYSEQDDAVITCTSSYEQLDNIFLWLKDGLPIDELPTTNTSNTSTLYINNITAALDGGVYTCIVENIVGSSNASVSLNVIPSFIQVPSDVYAVRGENVSFTCLATAFPEPSYQWLRTNGDLPPSVIDTASNSTLIFSPVQYEDEGAYVCSVTSNGVSENSPPAYLFSELYSNYTCTVSWMDDMIVILTSCLSLFLQFHQLVVLAFPLITLWWVMVLMISL